MQLDQSLVILEVTKQWKTSVKALPHFARTYLRTDTLSQTCISLLGPLRLLVCAPTTNVSVRNTHIFSRASLLSNERGSPIAMGGAALHDS